jgi:hypothetical protein
MIATNETLGETDGGLAKPSGSGSPRNHAVELLGDGRTGNALRLILRTPRSGRS